MDITWTQNGGFNIARIDGKIDSNTAPELLKQIEEKISSQPGNLIIDFSGVDYISSAGLRVVIKTNHHLSANGDQVILCGLKDYVREVFDLAGLGKILEIRENVDSAIQ